MTADTPAVELRDVYILFGDAAEAAMALAAAGESRETILAQTGTVLGVAACSMEIERGEICVLMGLSGSGKSTLLRAINGLNKVTRGAVLIANEDGYVDVAACDAGTLRRLRMERIAMVFQQFGLLPWASVAENVGLGLELRGLDKDFRHRIVEEKLRMVGLDAWRDKFAHELSGGMQQRVGLARAFATDADILLMDEPFSALDPLIRSRLQDELLQLQASLRKTIVFVSHDLDEAIKLGTHIAIMDGGRIVQYGKPEQIVLNPANRYVADFVAHMNPLQVLRCGSLMTPIELLRRDGEECLLDWSGHSRVVLDEEFRPVRIRVDGIAGRLQPYRQGIDLDSLERSVVVTGLEDMRMHTAIRIRYRTGTPVIIEREGRMVGVVGDEEIYRGMLRQTGVSASLQP